MPLFTSDGLGLDLVTLVLVLRIWSCLHHWYDVDDDDDEDDDDDDDDDDDEMY